MIRAIPPLLLTLAYALPATAGVDVEEAKRRAGDLVTRGNQLFDAGSFSEALASFQEAYDTFPSPKIHYNLARTLAACDRPLEAIEHYQRFLSDAGLEPEDSRYRKAEEEMAHLDDKVGKLAFVTDAAGSKLALDDHAPLPLPEDTIRVEPGPHRISIQIPDGRNFRETVDVRAGETTRVHVLFPPVPAPAPPPAPPPAPALAPPPPPAADVTASANVPITRRWWFWTAIGAAVVAVGAGVAIGVSSRSAGDFVRDGELDVTSTAYWDRRN